MGRRLTARYLGNNATVVQYRVGTIIDKGMSDKRRTSKSCAVHTQICRRDD